MQRRLTVGFICQLVSLVVLKLAPRLTFLSLKLAPVLVLNLAAVLALKLAPHLTLKLTPHITIKFSLSS